MTSSGPHWVTELFPPAFGFTLEEIEKLPIPDVEKGASNKEEAAAGGEEIDNEDVADSHPALSRHTPRMIGEKKKPLTIFEQHSAHHIAPEDVASIKNVYQRVWLMNKMKGETELKLDLPDGPYRDKQTCTSDLAAYWDDDTIWTTSEINVLRQVFKKAQKQNNVLSAHLKGQNEEHRKLKSKHEKQEVEFVTATSQLQEVRKANKRLQIMSANLKQMLDETNKRVVALEKHILALQRESKDQVNVIHEQQMEIDKERLTRKRLEQDLSHKDSKARSEMKLNEDKLELLHQREIVKLQTTIGKLQAALADEVKDHQRSKKGLDVLRNHFSSLPYSGEERRKNMVIKDALASWTQ